MTYVTNLTPIKVRNSAPDDIGRCTNGNRDGAGFGTKGPDLGDRHVVTVQPAQYRKAAVTGLPPTD